ncbi:hypothetical protein C2G38_192185 [Gigaspora rosea]|uniref:Ubiquitin carboxyl-terminal hydrolase 7 ICP0-binding domain-containing protein n=1 Tax=Gigaspora rosea TaxID=44941 RepID=A0A397UMD3_9GLOM|nr:hypothetical protein C2G38_192185 [Gigaspora rosea]
MPNPDLEIKDFQYYTWRITGWDGLEKRVSREFEAGGWKWRISLDRIRISFFSIKNITPDSICLEFADPEGAPAGWNSYVQFAFLLWNPKDITAASASYQAYHRFIAKQPNRGFGLNSTRSLIVNKTCNITAFVRILEDPTDALYSFIKIVTPDTFARYQGFDLANFDDQQYLLFKVPQFKVLKSETCGTFKSKVALEFGYSAEQIRFWVFVNRQNNTVRPDTPITDNFIDLTIGEIYTKIAAKQDELKFFMEVAVRPINDK